MIEQIGGVMGSRGSLGMVLDRKEGQLPVPQSFQGPVIQVDVSQFHFLVFQRLQFH